MIRSFASKATEKIFGREAHKRVPPDLMVAAKRKLDYLNRARDLNDLRVPPGNRLEPLKGARKGQHSIRINDQWRICLRWHGRDAYDVEIVDYHRG